MIRLVQWFIEKQPMDVCVSLICCDPLFSFDFGHWRRMGSNLGVLLLNKLLLSYWDFKQPVLLTFLHMISGAFFIWGMRAFKFLSIQKIQSAQQLTKVITLSLVFACAVLCANVSLKFLAVSMNQAIGAATPVFAAVFALLLQGVKRLSPRLFYTFVVHCLCRLLSHLCR